MTVCLAHRRNRTRTQALCVLYSMFFPLYHSYRACGRRTVVISSVQFSLSVMSNSLQYHRLQHNRPPYPSPTPGTYSNSWPLSPWYHTTIPSCHPLLLLPAILPSIRIFSNESVCIRWPKYWSFSFSISPSKENPGLIPFRVDWLDLLAVQGNLRSLLQQFSTVQKNQFFGAQLSL